MKPLVIISLVVGAIHGPCMIMAQSENQILFNDQQSLQKISKGGGSYHSAPVQKDIEGSPLLFNWANAQIVVKGQSSLKDCLVTYDASRDIFLMREKSVVWEMNDQMVDTLTVEGKRFIPLKGGYYELLNTKGIPFLKKYRAEILKPTHIPALNTGTEPSSWKISNSYFVFVKSEVKEIKMSRKSIQTVLNLEKKFMEEMTTKRLRFNNEMDVSQILEYLE